VDAQKASTSEEIAYSPKHRWIGEEDKHPPREDTTAAAPHPKKKTADQGAFWTMTSKQAPTFTPLQGPVTALFLEEAERLRLRFCCEECIFFQPEQGGRCLYNYPNTQHRRAYFEEDHVVGRVLIFCREFEIL